MPAHSPEEIHALIAAAFNAGDLDAFIELHEEDAVALVPPDGRRVSGRDAIRAAVEPIFALGPSARIEVVGKLQADGLAPPTLASTSSQATAGNAWRCRDAGRSSRAGSRTAPGASCSTTR